MTDDSIEGRLDRLGASVDALAGEIRQERIAREEEHALETANRRRWVVTFGVILILIAGLGGFQIHSNTRTDHEILSSRTESRCAVRSGFVDLANAAKANPELVLTAIRRYDARMRSIGAAPCGGVALCRDGSYSESIGAGACSHHHGVKKILVR